MGFVKGTGFSFTSDPGVLRVSLFPLQAILAEFIYIGPLEFLGIDCGIKKMAIKRGHASRINLSHHPIHAWASPVEILERSFDADGFGFMRFTLRQRSRVDNPKESSSGLIRFDFWCSEWYF